MMDRFKEKIGPLPVWVWGVILGLLIVGYMWFRRRSGTDTTPTTGSTQVQDTDQEISPNAQLLAGINTSGIPLGSLTGASTVPNAPAPTNSSWLAQGIARATDMNFTPLDAETALRKYLSGQSLSPAQAAIVNPIIQALGSPPQGVSGIPSVEPPVVDVPSPKATYTRFVRLANSPNMTVWGVKSDGTREGLTAEKYLSLGRPAFQDVPATDPVWALPTTGGYSDVVMGA